MGRVTRVYGSRPVVSRGMCLPLSQGYEESSRVRRAEISHNTRGVRVVDKVHPRGPLVAPHVGAMRPRPLARPREGPAADQAHVGDRMVRGAKRPDLHRRRAVTPQAGDAVDARGLEGFGVIAGRMVVRRRVGIDLPAPKSQPSSTHPLPQCAWRPTSSSGANT